MGHLPLPHVRLELRVVFHFLHCELYSTLELRVVFHFLHCELYFTSIFLSPTSLSCSPEYVDRLELLCCNLRWGKMQLYCVEDIKETAAPISTSILTTWLSICSSTVMGCLKSSWTWKIDKFSDSFKSSSSGWCGGVMDLRAVMCTFLLLCIPPDFGWLLRQTRAMYPFFLHLRHSASRKRHESGVWLPPQC